MLLEAVCSAVHYRKTGRYAKRFGLGSSQRVDYAFTAHLGHSFRLVDLVSCLDRCAAKFFDVQMKISEELQQQANSRGAGGGLGFGGL